MQHSALKELTTGTNFLIYYPGLAKYLGSAEAAILLDLLIDYSDQTDDGWFSLTEDEIYNETALTPGVQKRLRKILLSKGVVEIERRGIPARLFYRINWEGAAGGR